MPISSRNICWISLCLSTLASCSDTGNKYRSMESLERPPEIAINAEADSGQMPAGAVTTSESIKEGLNDQVHLDRSAGASKLVIGRPFDQAWFILGVLLDQLKLEVTDRNRDEGYYYVKYDPDIDYAKPRGFWDGIKTMFGENNYAERIYSVKLLENYGETEVTAEFAPKSGDKAERETDKQEDAAKDGPDRLLQALYKTLHDGLMEQSRHNRPE